MSCHPSGPTMATHPLPWVDSRVGIRKGVCPAMHCKKRLSFSRKTVKIFYFWQCKICIISQLKNIVRYVPNLAGKSEGALKISIRCFRITTHRQILYWSRLGASWGGGWVEALVRGGGRKNGGNSGISRMLSCCATGTTRIFNLLRHAGTDSELVSVAQEDIGNKVECTWVAWIRIQIFYPSRI